MKHTHPAEVTWQTIHLGRAVEIRVRGRLSRADYDQIMPQIEAFLQQTPRLGFLVILKDFHGWDAGAVWADARFDFRHRHQIGRVAIVGDTAWERWGTRASSLMLPWDVRFFEPNEVDAAREWVRVQPTAEPVQ